MNYYRIGQQIRRFRKAHGLSQEQLAEMLDTCSAKQVRIITDVVRATKISLDKHL